MIRVALIGAGNVAIHLAKALEKTVSFKLVQYFSRHDKNNHYFPESVPQTSDIDSLVEADIYLIAVTDRAIQKVASQLSNRSGLVLHTSGSIPMSVLNSIKRHGVFYPVQTFSKEGTIDWKKTPLALEASSAQDMELLRRFASEISDHTYEIDSERRKKLHLSAVFANNFSNHMFTLAKAICDENELDFELLKPLIQETSAKVMSISPEQAQTGPARRHDVEVLKEQTSQLNVEQEKIYTLLSESISKRYRRNES